MALSFIRGVLFERVTVTISSPKEHIGTFFSDSKIFRFVLWNVNLKKRNKNNIDESFVLLLSILNFVDEWCFPSILEKRRRWRIKGEVFFQGVEYFNGHALAHEEIQFSAEKVRSENGGPLLHGGDPYARERVKTWRRWNLLDVRAVVTLYRLRWINSTNTVQVPS